MYSSIPSANLFAVAAFALWPLLCIFLYSTKPVVPATVVSILAAQFLLPAGLFFKFPMLPQIDKDTISSFCNIFGYVVIAGRPLHPFKRFSLVEILICSFLCLPVVTSAVNGDAIIVGGTVIPGVGIYDGLSAFIAQLVALIPFFLGRTIVKRDEDLLYIFKALGTAGLCYSILLLFEIRFSPQLTFWVYGFSPSEFLQELRDGGFRPMVFMGHGLIASFFLMTTVVASATLWRLKKKALGLSPAGTTTYLGAVLVLCKSGAAIVYAVILVPLVKWVSPKAQLKVAACLAFFALLYPAMRVMNIFPIQTVIETARALNEERSKSLAFRFNQESQLLQKVSERPWFGWGRYGRNRVYEENWQGVGKDTSITDGRWIITLGQFGLLGFLAEFGLIAAPIFRAAKVKRSLHLLSEPTLLSALALLLSINMIDLLPNSTLNSWTWFLAGALLGRSETFFFAKRTSSQTLGQLPQEGDRSLTRSVHG